MTDAFIRRGIRTQTVTERRQSEDTGSRWSFTSQGDKPWKKPTLPTPWSQIFSFQSCEKINFCCVSHPVWGILPGSPSKLIRTPIREWSLRTLKTRASKVHSCNFISAQHFYLETIVFSLTIQKPFLDCLTKHDAVKIKVRNVSTTLQFSHNSNSWQLLGH